MIDKTVNLMNIFTGSVDTYENWESDSKEIGWNFEKAIATKDLVEVENINGDWVEIK
jgi:hypothetical protein